MIDQKESVEVSSKELEMIVLGCMLNSQKHLRIAQKKVKEEDFSDEKHIVIFEAINEVHKQKGVVDLITICEHLKRNETFLEVGGYPYLMDLCNVAGSSAHIEAYCDDLRQMSTKRALFQLQQNLYNELENGTEPHSLLDRIKAKVEDLRANTPGADFLYKQLLNPISEGEVTEEMKNTSPGVRVGMKIGEIDLKLPGGAITIVAGPTGHGKTLVLVNFILNYLSLYKDQKAYFFSYEESRSAILSLFLNTYANVDFSKNNREAIKGFFREGLTTFASQAKKEEFLKRKDEFFKTLVDPGRLNIFYSDYSAEELIESIYFLKKNTNIGLIGIDYMQLLRMSNKKNIPRQEELKQICLMLKDCAVATGLPIVLAAQFNRSVVNEATISQVSIGEAGDIERAANMIIGLWNRNFDGFTEEGNKGKGGKKIMQESAIYLEILKGRETGIGHASLYDLNGNTGKLTPQPKKLEDNKEWWWK